MHSTIIADAHSRGFEDALAGAEISDCPFNASGLSEAWFGGWGVARATMAAKLQATTPKRQSAEFATELSATMFAISQREHGAQHVEITQRDGLFVVHWTEHTTD